MTRKSGLSKSLSAANSKYSAALIGCGRIGCEFPDSHFNAYIHNPNIKLIGLCDQDIDKAIKYSIDQTVGAEPYEFCRTLRPDIVSICTPPETHWPIVNQIVPFVKAIWLEKPIALTLEHADNIIEVCKQHGVLLQVNHQRRATIPTFRFSRGWLNTGTHAIDLLRQYFGEIASANSDFVYFKNGVIVRIKYQDTSEPIFHLDMTHSGEEMLPAMLDNIIFALDGDCPLISPGEEARETLKWVLRMKEDYEAPRN